MDTYMNNPEIEELMLLEEELNQCNYFEMDAEDSYVGDAFSMYLKEMGQEGRLNAQEEIELGKLMAEGGEQAKAAREKLVNANLRLALYCAKKYVGHGVELEDLNSMGLEGLLKAVDRFDYKLGFKFSTYAMWWIYQTISRGIAYEGNSIRIPVHMHEIVSKVKRAQKTLQASGIENPTPGQISEQAKVPLEKVKVALESIYKVISFDAKRGEDEDCSLADFIADENATDPFDEAWKNELRKAEERVLSCLSEKEAKVLRLRNGIGCSGPKTLEEIGDMEDFNVSRERVRQIENKALAKIRRNPMLRRELLDFVS